MTYYLFFAKTANDVVTTIPIRKRPKNSERCRDY